MEKKAKACVCPKCRGKIPAERPFARSWNRGLQQQTVVCPHCGALLKSEESAWLKWSLLWAFFAAIGSGILCRFLGLRFPESLVVDIPVFLALLAVVVATCARPRYREE